MNDQSFAQQMTAACPPLPSWADLHRQGLTAREAAAVRGQTRNAAVFWARHAGVIWAGQRITKPSDTTWADCHAKGMTAAEAAQAMGRDPKTAYRWAVVRGLRWAPVVASSSPTSAGPEAEPLDPIDPHEVDPVRCRQLWLCVAAEMMRLSLNGNPKHGKSRRVSGQEKLDVAQARAWWGTPGFVEVCDLIGIDPGRFHKWYLAAYERGARWIDGRLHESRKGSSPQRAGQS